MGVEFACRKPETLAGNLGLKVICRDLTLPILTLYSFFNLFLASTREIPSEQPHKANLPKLLGWKQLSSLLGLCVATKSLTRTGLKSPSALISLQKALWVSENTLLESTHILLPKNGIQMRHPSNKWDLLQVAVFKSTRCFPLSNEI